MRRKLRKGREGQKKGEVKEGGREWEGGEWLEEEGNLLRESEVIDAAAYRSRHIAVLNIDAGFDLVVSPLSSRRIVFRQDR